MKKIVAFVLFSMAMQFANGNEIGLPSIPREIAAKIGDISAMGSLAKTEAVAHIGTRYRWGGETPKEGFDCSGLVQHVFETKFGIRLPRRSVEMKKETKKINPNAMIPGDLVFFNTTGIPFSHVGIYLGQDRFVHAPRTGREVSISKMSAPYWEKHFNGARRASIGDNNRDMHLFVLGKSADSDSILLDFGRGEMKKTKINLDEYANLRKIVDLHTLIPSIPKAMGLPVREFEAKFVAEATNR